MAMDNSKDKSSKQNDTKSQEEFDIDMMCGIGAYPPFLQRCGNITCYGVCQGLMILLTNALNSYMSSQITTVEKQFNFSSSQSGLILSSNDIGFILTVLFVSHFGIRYHIPRVLSIFTIFYGLSGIAVSLLHFVADQSMPSYSLNKLNERNNSVEVLCTSNFSTSACESDKPNTLTSVSSEMSVLIMLCIFMGIQGVGKTPRSSLGTYYIDRNVKDKTQTGFYLGIPTTMGFFGPFLAITLGGLFGKIPVDLKDTLINPKDPRWIGAWWIGFLLFGILAVVVAVPLACFPRRMVPKTEHDDELEREKDCLSVVKDVPKALLRIVRRPVYPLVVIGVGIYMFALIGGVSFGPKYIENQFNTPTWKANIIMGAEKLVTATAGTFLGGYITARLKLTRQGCIKMMLIFLFITIPLNSLNYIFGCNNPTIHGKENNFSMDCNCDEASFMAVCDGSGKTYYSPCHAGCTNSTSGSYGGCSGVDSGLVTNGICDTGCTFLIPYVSVQVINTFFGTMTVMPLYLVMLRSLDEKDRSIAFGMQSFFYALAVFMPAPIVFGQLYDSFCKEWKTSCGVTGACALYDIEKMRYTLTTFEVGSRCIGFIFYIIIFHLAKREDAQKTKHSIDNMELDIKTKI